MVPARSPLVAFGLIILLGCGDDAGGGGSTAASTSATTTATTAATSSSGGGGGGGAPIICDDEVGLIAPLPVCTPENPCTHVAEELRGQPITTPSDPPACADPRWTEAPEWYVEGVTRYACVYSPPGAATTPRPLVIFFHPGGIGADVAEQETHLLDKAEAYDLTGDPNRAGFHLAVIQGRNLHFPTVEPRDGRHHDFYHRDLSSPSGNPDIAASDGLIDLLAAEGNVDVDRIYVVGWSNGGFFGQLYAIARHETATSGGHRVAAAAVFATASPFDDIQRSPFTGEAHIGPSCKLAEIPPSAVPILLTHRTCDFATPCGASDWACFGSEPGFVTADWLSGAASALPNLEGRLIGGVELGAAADSPAGQCTTLGQACDPSLCTENVMAAGCLCLVNHLRWPDGDYANGSGVDNEPAMLDFLRAHPLE